MSELTIDLNRIRGDVTSTTTKVDNLTGEVSSLTDKTGALELTATGFNTKIAELTNELVNVGSGGKNLILESNKVIRNSSYLINRFTLSEDFIPDQTYTLTIKGDINEDSHFGVWQNGGSTSRGSMIKDEKTGFHTLTFVSSTTLFPQDSRLINIYNRPNPNPNRGTATIEWIKLEKGNRSTGYSPAPEDVDMRIKLAETAIDQKADSIDLRATKTQIEGIAGRMTKAEGEISVQADQITQRVSRDGIISAINLTPESVKIDTRLLQVGNFSNMVPNSNFENGLGSHFVSGGSWVVRETSVARVDGARVLESTSLTSENRLAFGGDHLVEVQQDEEYYFSIWARASNPGGATTWRTVRLSFRTVNPDGSFHSFMGEVSVNLRSGIWTKIQSSTKIPAGAYRGALFVRVMNESGNQSVYFSDPFLGRKNNAQLIVDGAITADKMAAGSITAGNAALANAAITRANLQEAIITNAHIAEATIQSAKLANVSADKINTGTLRSINLSAVNITGSIFTSTNGNNTTTIRGGYFDSRGRYTRTWFGSTKTHTVSLRASDGYFMAENINEDRRLYFSDFGISTFLRGYDDENANYENHGSGVIEFFSHMYNSGEWDAPNVRGLTLFSNRGNIALKTEFRDVILDAERNVKIISSRGTITLRPRDDRRAGNNHFQFGVKNNNSPSDTDGWIAYGSPLTNFGSGLRFQKTSAGEPYLWVTNGNGDKGTGSLSAKRLHTYDWYEGISELKRTISML
ncbi:carbohydrate binding domain-containing protein [Bacillus sp. JCM 19041]|uniref:carbohydrate binding domain-containing protein n=1 Tax=Bacillus sp. JCM 19041 TaxID=1460637 RepID=UPI0009E93E72